MKVTNCLLWCVLFGMSSSVQCATAAGPVSDFPSRPIRWIVPQAPGGAADTLSRIIAAQLEGQWNKPLVIDNRAGANGIIGSDIVAKSSPNGYTWLTVYAGNHATNPSVYKRLPYDPLKDFQAVATLATVPYLIVVNGSVPAKDLRELMDLARRSPKQINYGAPTGSVNHLLAVMIQSMARVEMIHVPYKSAGAALIDVMAGRIQASVATTAAAGQLTRAGKVRAVAITSGARSALYPEIPTVAESGFRDFKASIWFGVVAPAGTPQPLVRHINSQINKLLGQKETVERFTASGADIAASSPEEFDRVIREDLRRWAEVVKSAGVTAE
jgi:tripartite-type tricarboxylate transporter receptor subunit TctC